MEKLKKDAVFHPKHVAPDGNCLFHAVVHLLNPYRSQSLEAVSLRKQTVDHILDETDEGVTSILKTWIGLWSHASKERDREMMRELSHVEGVSENLETQDRNQLARQMMDPMRWWGDEFALVMMERDLNINFVVLQGFSGECVKRDYARPRKHVAFLRLNDAHYEPLYQGSTSRTLFDKNTLPIPSYLLIYDAGLAENVFERSICKHFAKLVADAQQEINK